MTEQYKVKLKRVIKLMARENGVSSIDLRKLKTPNLVLSKSLTSIGISFTVTFNKNRKNFTLKTSKRDAYNLIDDYEDNPLANKYDYTAVLSEMKKRLLSKEEVCSIVGCRKQDYVNIITFLSMKYPIYEEDDERVGYLTY
jgi:hypothetical protein